MVNRNKRDIAISLILALENSEISNYEFSNFFNEKVLENENLSENHFDRALYDVFDFCWGLYSDLCEHKLQNQYALKKDDKEKLDRWKLFLKTDLEYESPLPRMKFSRTFVNLLMVLVTLGYWSKVQQREYKRIFESEGYDLNVWPFQTRDEMEKYMSISNDD